MCCCYFIFKIFCMLMLLMILNCIHDLVLYYCVFCSRYCIFENWKSNKYYSKKKKKNSKAVSLINSSNTCWGTFKNTNPFDFPVFLSIGISALQFWCRYSVDLCPINSFISSSVAFMFNSWHIISCYFVSFAGLIDIVAFEDVG